MSGVRRGGVPSHGRDAPRSRSMERWPRRDHDPDRAATTGIRRCSSTARSTTRAWMHEPSRASQSRASGARLSTSGPSCSPDRVEKCVERALFRGMTSAPALWAYLDETGRQGRRGVQPLRAVLELRGRLAPAESDLETEMIQLIRRGGSSGAATAARRRRGVTSVPPRPRLSGPEDRNRDRR